MEKKSVFWKKKTHYEKKSVFWKNVVFSRIHFFFRNAHYQMKQCFLENSFFFRNAHYQTKQCFPESSFFFCNARSSVFWKTLFFSESCIMKRKTVFWKNCERKFWKKPRFFFISANTSTRLKLDMFLFCFESGTLN